MLAALIAVLAAGGVIATGAASTSTKNATAVLSPGSAAAGSASTYAFTLTNDPSSNQTLGSANVSVAPGFTVDASSFLLSRPWAASLDGDVIQLRAGSSKNAIAPGESLRVTFTATAPCSTPEPAEWRTLVKQSNNFLGTGNDFAVGEQPSVAVTSGGAGRFAVAAIPSPQSVGHAFDVTVTALDGCGNRDRGFSGSPQLSGLASSATASPSYGALVFSDGVATAAVTAVAPQPAAQLTVSDGVRSGTSDPFDVVNVVCTSSSSSCTAADDGDVTSVGAPVPRGNAKLAISFTRTGTGCFANPIGSSVTIDPIGYTAATQITFTWDKSIAPGTGVANFVLCWSKPDQAPAQLPKCGKNPQTTCELRRSRTGVGDLEIVVLLAPFDPSFDLG